MDVESTLRSIISANRQSRERFEQIASRTVDAIFQGDRDELGNIIRDATSDDSGASQESGPESMEAGNVDGIDGVSGAEETSGGN